MVTHSVHLVRISKTRLSLSHLTRSTLHDQAANTYFDMLQQCGIQSTYDSLYRLPTTTTTCSSIAGSSPRTTRCTGYQPHRHTPVNPIYFKNRDINLPTSTNTSYSPRSSSCLSMTSTNTSDSPRSSSCCFTTSTNTSYRRQPSS